MNIFGKLMAKLNFTNLINNNTGVSSKNFFLVAVTLIGAVLLAMVIISIIVDLIHNGTVTMSWADMAGLLFALKAEMDVKMTQPP